ncbi:four helix bundle protein [Parabacteroides sp. OttesenSCG-928-G07]|nr:four helix bundle protein [Parabacteroides sp. OttesenSCG-928-G21]MDL2278588.1 four helix bundle protein [Parabacteroides sp. OttesenSCG-928-G07]
MGKIESFEDLAVWKEGMRLSVRIYSLLKNCRDYGLKDQMQRSVVSIPSNISEGFERQTNKEFIQYLYIAKGSCGELRTQLYIAKELGYLSDIDFKEILDRAKQLTLMLAGLIKTRQTRF